MFEWLKSFVEHLGDRDMTTYTQYVGDLEDFEKNDGKFQGLCPPSQDVVDADMKVFDADAEWLDGFINTGYVDGKFVDLREDETITNEAGGKQSRISTRFDLIPADVLYEVSVVLAKGAIKYGDNNWKSIPVKDHLAHAMEHINRESHLIQTYTESTGEDYYHAICRLMFAVHLLHNEVL